MEKMRNHLITWPRDRTNLSPSDHKLSTKAKAAKANTKIVSKKLSAKAKTSGKQGAEELDPETESNDDESEPKRKRRSQKQRRVDDSESEVEEITRMWSHLKRKCRMSM